MGVIFSLPAFQQKTLPVLGNEEFSEGGGLQQGSSQGEGTRESQVSCLLTVWVLLISLT